MESAARISHGLVNFDLLRRRNEIYQSGSCLALSHCRKHTYHYIEEDTRRQSPQLSSSSTIKLLSPETATAGIRGAIPLSCHCAAHSLQLTNQLDSFRTPRDLWQRLHKYIGSIHIVHCSRPSYSSSSSSNHGPRGNEASLTASQNVGYSSY